MKAGPIGDRKHNPGNLRKLMLQNRAIEKQRQRQLRREAAAANINKGGVIVNSAEECTLNYGLDNIHSVQPEDGNNNEGIPLLRLIDEFKLFINHKMETQCTGKQAAQNKDILSEGEQVPTQDGVVRSMKTHWEKTKK